MGDNWQLFLALMGLLGVWSGVIMGASKWMLGKLEERMKEKISALGEVKDDCDALEREFLQMKADLPLYYVRREDFIRFDLVINTKLDKLRDLIEKALRGGGTTDAED